MASKEDENGPVPAEAGSGNTVNWEGDIHGSPNIDISQVIEGVAPEKYAEALAQIQILKEKLAIAQVADKDDPTEEEVLAAGEALRTAEDLEEIGVIFDELEKARLSRAAKLAETTGRTLRKVRAFTEEPVASFNVTGNMAALKLNFPQLGKICILLCIMGTFTALSTSPPSEANYEPSDIEACYAGETTPEEMGFPGYTCEEIDSRAENEMLLVIVSWSCFLPVGICALWIASSKSNSGAELESATDTVGAEQQDKGE